MAEVANTNTQLAYTLAGMESKSPTRTGETKSSTHLHDTSDGELSEDERLHLHDDDVDDDDEDIARGDDEPEESKHVVSHGSPQRSFSDDMRNSQDLPDRPLFSPDHNTEPPYLPSSPAVFGEQNHELTGDTRPDQSSRQNSSKTTENFPADDEHEALRKEAVMSLTDIENQFAKFREKMYMERLSEYEREHLAIRKGTHPTLVKQMEEFDQKKEERLRAAAARLRFEQMSFQRQYESAVAQAQTDFICKRGDLRRQMIAEIEQKRWQMYDEKRKIDLVELGPVIPDRATCLKRRKALQVELIEWRAIISNGGFPAATIPGLTKNEINEDLELIGIQTARSHSVPGGRTKKPQPQNLNGKGSSDSVMRMPAPPLQPSYSVGVTYSKIEEGSAATFDVHVDGDLLRYQGLPFRRNDKAYLFDNGSKYSIKITGITHSEILVQRTDGSRTRIPIEHLEDGRMQLQPKGHG